MNKVERKSNEAWRNSKWGDLLDTYQKLIESYKRIEDQSIGDLCLNTQGMEAWFNWMVQGGFQRPDEEIAQRIEEYEGLSPEEKRSMIRDFINGNIK